MDKRTKDIVVATLAIGAAAASLYFGFAGHSPKVNLDTYDVLGAVTAEETAKLLNDKGKVLIIARDTGPDKNPSVEAELRAFQQTFKRHSGLSLTIERVQLTPLMMMSTGGAVPPEELFKALQTHANVGAVVLFLAFPSLSDSEMETLKKLGVKTVVVSSVLPAYSRLIEQQAIQLAIVPRPDTPETGAQAPRTLRERFDRDFTILRSTSTQ